MVRRPCQQVHATDKPMASLLMKLLLINMIFTVSSTASTSMSNIQSASFSNDVKPQGPASSSYISTILSGSQGPGLSPHTPNLSSSSSQGSPAVMLGNTATEGTTTTLSHSQSITVLTQSRASNSSGSQVSSTVSLGNAVIKFTVTSVSPFTPSSITHLAGTKTSAPFTLTSSGFLGLSSIVPGEAIINGSQTMTHFVYLSMTRNLQNGTQSVAASTSLPSNTNPKNDNHKGGLIYLRWWGTVGWGLCLSCTPNGIDPKINGGTHITIDHFPKWPTTSPPRCLFPFPCPNPPPGTDVQTVEGVENQPPGNQPSIDVDDPDTDPEPSESANPSTQPATPSCTSCTSSESTVPSNSATSVTTSTHRATTTPSASTSSASSVATSFAIYPASANYTAINNAFNSSLYQIADPATIYVSVEEDEGILFWLADLNPEQAQNLSNYGVSLSNSKPPIYH